MPDVIQELFLNPPLAVARLGGSSVPQDAYRWAQAPNPRSSAQTVVEPDWSLTVEADGTVTPHMPSSLRFRDGALIRPVAPFVEVWARVGAPGSDRQSWREVPVTPALLAAQGVPLAGVRFRVTAINSKAARRTRNPNLRFGTAVEISGDDNRSVPLLAGSPPGSAQPMIPPTRNIALGAVQVIRSRTQPAAGSVEWADKVNVETLRLRFTPARGHMYGPPSSATPHTTPGGGSATPVDTNRAFLNPLAGWTGVDVNAPDQPADTFDGASPQSMVSLGVVDDTCEARIEVAFALPQQQGRTVSAASSIFVAPPDFAPDRRPFLSLADELNDRAADAGVRSASLSIAERNAWVEDLFERVQETVSLFNVDLWRLAFGRGARLSGAQLGPQIPGDATPGPTIAMGGRDRLRNRMFALAAPMAPDVLPLTKHARMRHGNLADLQALRDFVRQNPGRLQTLIRPPFARLRGEGAGDTTMAMPPFMRNSNAYPLTLARWQYELLMAWVADVEQGPTPVVPVAAVSAAVVAPGAEPTPLSEPSQRHRDRVLARLNATGPQR